VHGEKQYRRAVRRAEREEEERESERAAQVAYFEAQRRAAFGGSHLQRDPRGRGGAA